MGAWADFGFGALKSFTGGLMKAGFNELSKYTNYQYGEKAANNADKRWREQYNDFFTPEAMLKQYQQAGLSPSMMFSSGAHGTGGATAPQGSGASGPSGGFAPIDAPTIAQVKNIEADTKVKEAEAKNLDKDTEKKGQEITNLVTENGYKQVATRLVVAQADLAECNADLAWNTMEANIRSAYQASEHAANLARISGVQANLDESTYQAAYEKAWAELDKTLSETALNREEIKLTKQQIKDLGSQIWARQWQIHYEGRKQNRQDLKLSFDKQYMEQEISKWLREQNQWVEEMKLKGYEIKVNFLSDVLGYVFNLGGISLTNAAKPNTDVITETIVGPKGEITTKSKTISSRKL